MTVITDVTADEITALNRDNHFTFTSILGRSGDGRWNFWNWQESINTSIFVTIVTSLNTTINSEF